MCLVPPFFQMGLMLTSRLRCLHATWCAWKDFVLWSTQVRQVYQAHYDIEKAERDLDAVRDSQQSMTVRSTSTVAVGQLGAVPTRSAASAASTPAAATGSAIPATAMRQLQQLRRNVLQDRQSGGGVGPLKH